MFQFSIRGSLVLTLYCALAFLLANIVGFDALLAMHVFVLHFFAIFVLPVAAIQYQGYQRYFSIAALVTEGLFLFFSVDSWFRDEFWIMSLFAFGASYIAGLTSAGAYLAIVSPQHTGDSWRPLEVMTRFLSRFLPTRAQPPGPRGNDSETDLT